MVGYAEQMRFAHLLSYPTLKNCHAFCAAMTFATAGRSDMRLK